MPSEPYHVTRPSTSEIRHGNYGIQHSAIVTISDDGYVRVYRTRPPVRGMILAEHAAACTELSVTATRAVAATADGFLLVAGLESGTAARRFHLHAKQIEGLDVAPDGRRAVSQPQFESRVVDVTTGRVLHEARRVEPNRATRFLPGGCLVITDLRGRARLYDEEYCQIAEFGLTECPPGQVDVSPDGEYIAIVTLDGRLELFDTRGRE